MRWVKRTAVPNFSSILCPFTRLPLIQFHQISTVSTIKNIWLTSFPMHPWNPCQCCGRSCCLRPLKHLPKRRKHCSGLDNAAELRRQKPSGICYTIHFSKGVNYRKQYSWENYTRFLPPEILPKNRGWWGHDWEASVLLRKELLKASNYMNWRSCTEKFLEIIMLFQDNC